MAAVPPTDDELNTMIRARLASIGIDLQQLPATTTDPETGSPSQTAVLASLRGFSRSTLGVIASFQLPPAPGGAPADAAALQQQSSPPLLYPSITTAWTAS